MKLVNIILPWCRIKRAEADAKAMAWLVRASFELGYRAAKPDTENNEWRPAWRDTKVRVNLVDLGYIKEEDTWR